MSLNPRRGPSYACWINETRFNGLNNAGRLCDGLPNLSEMYAILFADMQTPAYKLTRVTLNLEHAGSFPEKEVLGISEGVKKQSACNPSVATASHSPFLSIPRRTNKGQKVCNRLGIDYEATQVMDPGKNCWGLNDYPQQPIPCRLFGEFPLGPASRFSWASLKQLICCRYSMT